MSLIGKTLGKYKLLELVGKGGMSYVYRAFDPDSARVVAIKVMHHHLCEDSSFVKRFEREAKAISQLQHANIVGFIDFDHEQDQYYLVMNHIDGGTLRDYLAEKEVLPPLQALQLLLHIAKALSYAHQKGIIHRDIKPSNIMFLDKSQSHPVLTDFGLARFNGHNHTTITNSIAGTPSYMSPEALHNEPIDERSDIYSLGVVLYKMVVGSTPYTANTPYGIFLKRLNEPLPTPRERNPKLPKEVDALILKALAKNPKQRYQSTKEFCSAIETTITKLSQQPAKFSLFSFLPSWNREPKPITTKRLTPPVSTVLGIEDSAFKSRRVLSAVLAVSSGIGVTTALIFMVLFGFNSTPAFSEADTRATPTAVITTQLQEPLTREQPRDTAIIPNTSQTEVNKLEKNTNDSQVSENEVILQSEVSNEELDSIDISEESRSDEPEASNEELDSIDTSEESRSNGPEASNESRGEPEVSNKLPDELEASNQLPDELEASHQLQDQTIEENQSRGNRDRDKDNKERHDRKDDRSSKRRE